MDLSIIVLQHNRLPICGKEYPDIENRYFKAKCKLTVAGKLKRYEVNNTVAVMSAAVGKDLFPWFRGHGFDVAKEQAEIQF